MRRSISVVVCLALVAGLFGGCSGGGGGGGNEGVISFLAAVFRQFEDGSPGMDITLQRVGGTAAVSVTLIFTGGSATGGVDYDNSPIVVNWAANDLADKVITVPVTDDNNDEQPGETVDLTLTSPTGGAILGIAFALLNINDDDIAGTVQFDAPVYADLEGSVPFGTVMVTRTGGTDGDVTVTITSSDVEANSNPNSSFEPVDYTPVSTTVTFLHGDATPMPVIPSIVDDDLPEVDENFTLTMSNPTNGLDLGAPSTCTVHINNDDLVMQIEHPSPVLNGFFGTSVAKIGPHLAIGAPAYVPLEGRVFSTNVDFGTLHETLSGGPFSQNFGTALSSSGNTLGVGGLGAAWSFGGDLFLNSYFERFSVSNPDDGFGSPVFVHGSSLHVGAPAAMIGGSLEPSGRAYTWDAFNGVQSPTLEGVADNRFGSALGAFGADLLVGAPGNNGQVLKFGGSPLGLNWVITNPFPATPPDSFGAAVAAIDAFTDSGEPAIIVGAPDADTFAPNDGRIYVFNGGDLTTILPPGPIVPNGRFGAQIFVTSQNFICVQQPGGGPSASGRVFVFDPTGGLYKTIDAPVVAPNGNFGAAMCEFDKALVIGAPNAPFFIQSGIVFIVSLLP